MWLYFCLTISSLAQVHKYTGWAGVAAYLILVAGAVRFLPRLPLSESLARWLGIGALCAVLGAFLFLYPVAKSGRLGLGSDGDDACNVAVHELLHGHNPYYAQTYLSNAIHQLPGALLLAAPFVVLGNSAYQNLFWLAMFLYVATRECRSARRALTVFWMLLAFCPAVLQQVVTGNDQLSNGIYTLVFLWLMMHQDTSWAPVLFGIGLSSRPNFLFLAPLAFAYLARERGMARAFRDSSIAAATFLVLTLPFYFYDPARFTPLEGANRLTRLDAILPHLGIMVGLAGVALTMWLCFRGKSLYRDAALVQAFFVVAGMVLTANVAYAGYGVFFLFFGALPNDLT